jgi:hypothetical protein
MAYFQVWAWVRIPLLTPIVTCFGLEFGFIGHFTTLLVITLDYSAIADFHSLQIHYGTC